MYNNQPPCEQDHQLELNQMGTQTPFCNDLQMGWCEQHHFVIIIWQLQFPWRHHVSSNSAVYANAHHSKNVWSNKAPIMSWWKLLGEEKEGFLHTETAEPAWSKYGFQGPEGHILHLKP